jgi:hypothetical protein
MVRWLNWISRQRPDLSERARLVTLLLVELSARNDHAFPSLRWLATHIGCSPSSVRLAIREAEQSGLVRRAERFDRREFSGGRQTSNRYEIILHPGLELQEGLGLDQDRELVIVDDESDPNQLELEVEAGRAQPVCGPSRPSIASARPRVAAPLPAPTLNGSDMGPLADQAGPPSQPAQGVKDLREELEEKAASTRVGERVRVQPEDAAAFLGEILSEERTRDFKTRFGHSAFASLLFALRRDVCREHPAVVKRALARLHEADGVSNPGGYFVRVFRDELEAVQLAGPPTAEDAKAEAAREEREHLLQRARELKARLEEVGCLDYGKADRIRWELDGLYTQIRALSGTGTVAPALTAAARPAFNRRDIEPSASARAEALAAAEEALELVRRGRRAEVTCAA